MLFFFFFQSFPEYSCLESAFLIPVVRSRSHNTVIINVHIKLEENWHLALCCLIRERGVSPCLFSSTFVLHRKLQFLLSVFCTFLCTLVWQNHSQDAAELNVVGEKPMIMLTGLTLHLLPQTSSGTLVLMTVTLYSLSASCSPRQLFLSLSLLPYSHSAQL